MRLNSFKSEKKRHSCNPTSVAIEDLTLDSANKIDKFFQSMHRLASLICRRLKNNSKNARAATKRFCPKDCLGILVVVVSIHTRLNKQ